jgi:hypothetical protein
MDKQVVAAETKFLEAVGDLMSDFQKMTKVMNMTDAEFAQCKKDNTCAYCLNFKPWATFARTTVCESDGTVIVILACEQCYEDINGVSLAQDLDTQAEVSSPEEFI